MREVRELLRGHTMRVPLPVIGRLNPDQGCGGVLISVEPISDEVLHENRDEVAHWPSGELVVSLANQRGDAVAGDRWESFGEPID